MRHLLSKIVAGGLSAGVILLWWPLVFPSDTVESWLIRGVLWTLCFELMLHSFAPLEESLWRSRAARRVTASLGTVPVHAQRGRFAVAAVALTVPVALLATAPDHSLSPKPVAAKQVRQVTQVKRVVRVERRTVSVPRAATAAPAPAPRSAATGLGVDTRRPVARRVAPAPAPRRTTRTGTGSGSRTGSPSPSTDTAAPTTASPSAGTSGERAATPPVAQPKRI